MGGLLEVAARVPVTNAEGPGRRFAVWVQGCSLRCPGCCNPQLFGRGRGIPTAVEPLLEQLDHARRTHDLEGLTVLGGEPLEQLEPVTELARGAARLGLGVIVFTGYRLAEARARPGFAALWSTLDTLVDGRYDSARPEPPPARGGRRFLGSRNQRLHHRTDRYRHPHHWRGEPEIEVHLDEAGRLSAHGAPSLVTDLLVALGGPRSKPSPKPGAS